MKRQRFRFSFRFTGFIIAGVIAAATVIGGSALYARPLPALTSQLVSSAQVLGAETANIAWPAYGQSAVGLAGHGVLSSSGPQKPMPTASVAKLMTALAILEKKPLTVGEQGPTYTITAADMAIYDSYLARDGSLATIQVGEQISEYDMLEALLLPSANNIADSLAIWGFGSVAGYCDFANQFAKDHNMKDSNFADASGFSPDTVSTADDLVRLGDAALQNPVIAEIVAKSTAEIPVAGIIHNVNGLLGNNGINGLKTGNTDEAGGVFLVSATRTLADNQQKTIIAAVMGAPNLSAAMKASVPLLDATVSNLHAETVVKAGQSFGTYTAPWSKTPVKAVAARDVSLLIWQGTSPKQSAVLKELKPLTGIPTKGADVGSVKVEYDGQTTEIPLVLESDINPPSKWWRVSRFF